MTTRELIFLFVLVAALAANAIAAYIIFDRRRAAKKAEVDNQRLQQMLRQFNLIFNSTSDMLALIRIEADGRMIIQTVNDSYQRSLELLLPDVPQDVLEKDRSEILAGFGLPKELIEWETSFLQQAVEQQTAVSYDVQLPTVDGFRAFETHVEPIVDQNGRCSHLLWSARDITIRKEAEDKVKASLAEKEILLQEIHHRVKNNLQTVSSLLYLQSSQLPDEAMRQLFQESRNRIAAMALVHEKLYQIGNLGQIPFDQYVEGLVTSLTKSFGVGSTWIAVQVEAKDIVLDIDLTITSGLLITEIVSNSLKHAFPNRRQGVIGIQMQDVAGCYHLSISDNGVGFSPEEADSVQGSLGLRLIEALVKQVDGAVERVEISPGTQYRIVFPNPRSAETSLEKPTFTRP